VFKGLEKLAYSSEQRTLYHSTNRFLGFTLLRSFHLLYLMFPNVILYSSFPYTLIAFLSVISYPAYSYENVKVPAQYSCEASNPACGPRGRNVSNIPTVTTFQCRTKSPKANQKKRNPRHNITPNRKAAQTPRSSSNRRWGEVEEALAPP
jgi:hypothetical protein